MKLGMRLNEKTLTDLKTGEEFDLRTERGVFAKLGVEYMAPHERENVGAGFHFTKADRGDHQRAVRFYIDLCRSLLIL